jgi:hypothetical protein
VVKALHKLPLSRSARTGRISGCVQDQCGLLKGILPPLVPQELKKSDIPRQVVFAHASQHPQGGLAEGKQARGAMFVDVTTRVCLLRVLDVRMERALHRPRAAGRIRLASAPHLDGEVCRLLYCLDCAIAGRLDDDSPLATDPGDDGRPVLVSVAPTRLALRAAPTCVAAQRLLATPWHVARVAGGVGESIGFHRACPWAMHLVGQRGMAEPPAPARARPDVDAPFPGKAP